MGDIHWTVPTGLPGQTYEDMDAAEEYCAVSTGWWNVGRIHYGMRTNPRGLTGIQMIRECFEVNGVPDGHGLSDDLFHELIWGSDFIASTDEGRICRWDPTGYENLTIEDIDIIEQNMMTIYSG